MAQVDSLRNVTTVTYLIDSVGVVERPTPIIERGNSSYTLKTSRLGQLPKLFGSVDAIRSLQLMPGIQTTGDIGSGLYVQGCEPAHNLFLIEEAPIYSPIHLLGFIPVINSDHLESVSVEKGFVSARDGGRLASVVRCDTYDRIPEECELSGDVNFLSSAVSLGVATSPKSALRLSARTSYANTMIDLLRSSGVKMGSDELSYHYNMSDINATWHCRPSSNDQIVVNGYYGGDKLKLDVGNLFTQSANKWSNSALSAKWLHKMSGGGELSTVIYNSQYSDLIAINQASIALSLASSINDSGVKLCYELQSSDLLRWRVGADFAYRVVDPQEPVVEWSDDNLAAEAAQSSIINGEYGLYAECDLSLNEHWSSVLGVRYSGVIKQSSGVEPRANLRFKTNSNLSLAASYIRQFQYINQVLVSGTGMPSNYFLPTTDLSPSQRSDNYSLDLSYKFPNRVWSLSSMLYYRKLKNQYENHSQLISYIVEDQSFDSRYDIATGENYGSEFLLRCNLGRLKGWLSYTLSWAERQSDTVDGGSRFYASNDRRHDLSVVATYLLSDRWSVASNFVFATGTPITLSTGIYCVGNQFINLYSKRNAGRMSAYHHLDLSASCKLNIPWFESSVLNISIYNIYARRNGVFFYSGMRQYVESGDFEIYNKSNSLYSILPSVGLTFKL